MSRDPRVKGSAAEELARVGRAGSGLRVKNPVTVALHGGALSAFGRKLVT